MNGRLISWCTMVALLVPAAAQNELGPQLEAVYARWRKAILEHDAATWQAVTAAHRRMDVRNRLVSGKQPFPAGVFDLPAAPPALTGLKLIQARQSGRTAKGVWFGPIDFKVDAKPTDNLLVLSFVSEQGAWKFDTAQFVSLAALPEARKELAAGDMKFVQEAKDCLPDGVVPPVADPLPPAKYIAKVYVFCPGRDVQVHVNKISRHHFIDTKDAEVVLGGAKDGLNEVQYSIKRLDGSTGKEALTVRVYLMSEVPDVKPVKVFEYQVEEGQEAKNFGSGNFIVDQAVREKLKAAK